MVKGTAAIFFVIVNYQAWCTFSDATTSGHSITNKHHPIDMASLLIPIVGVASYNENSVFHSLQYRSHLHHMDSLARAHCRKYIMKRYLKVWQEFVTTEQMLMWEKERMAEEHNTM